MNIRQAQEKDVSRIAEILVYNNRVNFFHEYLRDKERLQNTFVFDDGVIRGFIQLSAREIQKLYVDTFFQNMGIGAALISFAVKEKQSNLIPELSGSTKSMASAGQKNGHWRKGPGNIW